MMSVSSFLAAAGRPAGQRLALAPGAPATPVYLVHAG
jgi:hypothetical protein